jgi:tetratricopeptide (TPR) repeat protein
MFWRTVACLGLLLTGIPSQAQSDAKKAKDSVSVSFPGKTWAVQIDSPGFTVNNRETQKDGREYLLANNSKTGVELSVTLEESKDGADSSTCPDYLQQRVKALAQLGVTGIQTSELNSMAVVEFLIPSVQGVPVQQRNLIACVVKEDVYIDIHLSKAQFQPKDESLLTNVLKEVRFSDQASATSSNTNPSAAASSADYFREGSRLYAAQNFAGAIGPYEKALELEKNHSALSKDYWRVLVDNLGMAYGITGDLTRAEQTFNYGLSKDPTYPMFYYNLACTAAGRQDMGKAMEFLGKAFSLKANAIPGEGMPDPRRDDSFQRFMSNEQFRKFADSLVASSN